MDYFFLENNFIPYEEIDCAGDAQGKQVTYEHIPTGQSLDDQQGGHLDQEDSSTGYIVHKVQPVERRQSLAVRTATPGKIALKNEIDQQRTFEGNKGGEYIFSKVAAFQKEVGADPKYKHIHGRPHQV